jgi:aminoglycoside 3-N-acetyltransferase
MLTPQQLTADLARLGVNPSRDLFVHSSYKSVGPVDGAAAGIIKALQDSVPQATLLMPSFNLIPGGTEARAKNWNLPTTPSTVGYLTEFFRTMPGTLRSDHYSHSVAARGPKADFYTTGHRDQTGLESPWDIPGFGKTYGDNSPLLKLYDHNAQLLMLGVDYHSATFMHVAETIDFNRRKNLGANPNSAYFFIDRLHMGQWVDRHCDVATGTVGQACCRLLNIRPFVDAVSAQVKTNPAYWYKWFELEKL